MRHVKPDEIRNLRGVVWATPMEPYVGQACEQLGSYADKPDSAQDWRKNNPRFSGGVDRPPDFIAMIY